MGKKSKRRPTNKEGKEAQAAAKNSQAVAASYNYYGLTKEAWEGAAGLRYQINAYINKGGQPVSFLWDLWNPQTSLGSTLGVQDGDRFFAVNIDERFSKLLVASAVQVYLTWPSDGQLNEGRRLYTRYIVGILLHVETYLHVNDRDAFFNGFRSNTFVDHQVPQWRTEKIDAPYEKLQSIEQLVEFLRARSACSAIKQENENGQAQMEETSTA